MSYMHEKIDGKWQKRWQESGVFEAKNDSPKEKFYVLVEFPYPSGAGLHVGHPRSYTALDIVARKKRMEGKNVLFPMGWDAFGLPAENYAIKTGVHPSIITKQNIDTFRRQLQSIGFSFDWSREVNTTDPAYYKWTQWMFLQFFKAGLAYKDKMAINWCPSCKIGLANEEVVGGNCERCGGPVEKREKEQWMIAITKYADRLLSDLDTVDYLPKIKKQQIDWIGKKEGAEIDFVVDGDYGTVTPTITVFTTRPDTVFGVTYVVLAPEHDLVDVIVADDRRDAVKTYIEEAKKKTDIERGDDTKKKTGVFTGAYAVNPANGEKIPVWVADYVLAHYGTGAVMAVPAHDERDFAFAKAFDLPVRVVVEPVTGEAHGDDFEKEAIIAVVRNPKTHEVLVLDWGPRQKNWGGTCFVGGGIEEGETDVVAVAAREIAEETGYTDVEFVQEAPVRVHNYYYSNVKDRHDLAHCTGLLFDLKSDAKTDVALDEGEKNKFTPKWIPESEVLAQVNDDHAMVYKLLGNIAMYPGVGPLAQSAQFDGMEGTEASDAIVAWLSERGVGRKKVTYKLRDWVFSRQRYWGEPIPLVFCEACANKPVKDGQTALTAGWVPVPDSALPVVLPDVEKYQPTDTGESPLAAIDSFVNTTCPDCGGPARRETDTMPNWAGSSWYFLRYLDPKNDDAFASKDALKYWMPVDLYNGGMEHTTLHLLYSRFWNKFLFDQGLVPVSEPYARRHSHGLIMAEDGTKMSKSKGNVVNPDDIVRDFGADTLRVYEVFMGPFEEPVPWSTNGVIGVKRFLDKVARFEEKTVDQEEGEVTKMLHKTIAKVTHDIEGFAFNTAVAQLMTFANIVQEKAGISKESLQVFLRLLVPFAPHLANEIWEKTGGEGFVEEQSWPVADASLAKDDEVTIAVQVNGKVRGSIVVSANADEATVVAAARQEDNVVKHLTAEPKKTIIVPGRIVNFVV